MPIQNRNYFGAMEMGRQSRQQSIENKSRNALNQMEVGRQQTLNALMADPNATPDQFARAGRTDISNYMLGQQNAATEEKRQSAKMLVQAAQYALESGNPKEFIRQNYPQLAQRNPTFETDTDEQIKASLQEAIGVFGPQAGIGPAPAPVKYETVQGPRGARIQRNSLTGEEKQIVGPDNSQPSVAQSSSFEAMTPDEIKVYGLPPGSSAQINRATGQVQVLNKPSVAPQQSAAERKAMVEAKVKMPRVSAAMRRAERLDKAIQAIGKNWFLDGGPADAKALQYSKEGREVIAASAQLMPELTALTRVPGIGSQSDLESRLASLALPSLEFDPETNARSMAELHAFIQDLKAAYETIATGGAPVNDVPEDVGPAVATPALSLDDIRKKYGR